MNKYDENGYVNIKLLLNLGMPFNIVIGNRGGGKTYTALKVCKDEGRTIFFLRKTKQQADIIGKKELCPYKKLAFNEHFDFDVRSVVSGVYKVFTVDEQNEPLQQLGYIAGLSSMSNLRGFDASDVDTIIFDEFIPEAHERAIKNEADALFNAYETINRNRELDGEKPVQMLLLSNSNRLDSGILEGFGLMKKIEMMKRKKQTVSVLPERGIAIWLLDDSPIADKKEETVLYKATKGTDFSEMALKNEFAYSDMSNIESEDISNYKLIVCFDDIGVYKHRTEKKYYACSFITGSAKTYADTETDIKRFKRDYQFLILAIFNKKLYYENFEVKTKLTNVLL